MNITILRRLPPVEKIIKAFPLSKKAEKQVEKDRQEVKDILEGKDARFIVVVGPCSAWPKEAVIEYAKKLKPLSDKLKKSLKIVMRVYIQKPCTTTGWTGPVNQPDPFKPSHIGEGAKYCREMMVNVVEMGLPIADEAVFTHNAKGFIELLSWVAIGARSTEDQEHRVFASSLDCAVGMKNPTSGSIEIGVNSVVAAQYPHTAVFDGYEVKTSGNAHAHLILRGGSQGANYGERYVREAKERMEKLNIKNPAVILDVSHDNCKVNGVKNHCNQVTVVEEAIAILQKNQELREVVRGFMLESFLKEGSQKVDAKFPKRLDRGGLSITDPCLGFEQTVGCWRSLRDSRGGMRNRELKMEMKTIDIKIKKAEERSDSIAIGSGFLARLPEVRKKDYPASSYIIIADAKTKNLFGKRLLLGLRQAGCKALLLSVPVGEGSKSQKRKTSLEEAMLKAGIDRRGVVLALGGGVIGDLAGFVAATYMRGIPYIQLPTTLLAMVDSSVGGKTGINTFHGKNLIGAFHQPKAVYADIRTLRSLPDTEIRSGLTEAVKMFITSDRESFVFADVHLAKALAKDTGILAEIISRAVRIKAGVVERDERESGERMVLNFGHTIGHAIEKLFTYTLLHGQAVGVGMLAEATLAHRLGALSPEDLALIRGMLKRLLIPASLLKQFAPEAVIAATKGDKKSVGGQARYVILKKIGVVEIKHGEFVQAVEDGEVAQAIRNI